MLSLEPCIVTEQNRSATNPNRMLARGIALPISSAHPRHQALGRRRRTPALAQTGTLGRALFLASRNFGKHLTAWPVQFSLTTPRILPKETHNTHHTQWLRNSTSLTTRYVHDGYTCDTIGCLCTCVILVLFFFRHSWSSPLVH